ncbi:MAG: hypothetical protein JJ927_07875 [Balneola sp.]|nr:hypothetical protein [Balneola sp.]MBO6650928.1 hypothetical protein [Balneola sp.]
MDLKIRLENTEYSLSEITLFSTAISEIGRVFLIKFRKVEIHFDLKLQNTINEVTTTITGEEPKESFYSKSILQDFLENEFKNILSNFDTNKLAVSQNGSSSLMLRISPALFDN